MNERCFAMHWGECSALKVNCPGYQACKFYKPRWALEKEQRRIDQRLSRLPLEQQARIAEKYDGGEMPWRESAQMLENAHA